MMTSDRSADALQADICTMWRVLLEQAVQPDDDFFDLGGDSVLVVDFVVEAQGLGIPVKSADVFTNPTAASLAGVLAARVEATAQ